MQNNLPATCDTIYPGQTLLIPQPTPTPTELPTATISAGDATKQACGEVEYVPQANDTLGTIAANYAISITALKEYNGLVNDTIRGQDFKSAVRTAGTRPTQRHPAAALRSSEPAAVCRWAISPRLTRVLPFGLLNSA
jgi:LysM repeat protein